MKLNEKEIGKRVEDIRCGLTVECYGDYLTTEKISKLLNISHDEYIRKVKAFETFTISEIMFISELYGVDENYLLFGGVR